MKALPHLQEEILLWKDGYTVIGIDEVGRGAFAGPVYVSAVAFTPTTNPHEIKRLCALGINDSKKLTPMKRIQLHKAIVEDNVLHATASTDCKVINSHGITYALYKAVLQVTQELSEKLPQHKLFILLDGNDSPYRNTPYSNYYKNIIKGDNTSLSIAAASIVAKVARDKHMISLATDYPQYGWERNKGYGTADHRHAIQTYGPCNYHRVGYIKKYI